MTKLVNASPTKSFFVSMLTRDISLEDAILDLLDNCVDGINRSSSGKGPKPYEGYKAEIKFNAESFSIYDNCGGIPWDMRKYAFRMGRPPTEGTNVPGSVGFYGIGMKRAIFKLGERCRISTLNSNMRYNVEITPDWLRNEDDWNIPVHAPVEEKGGGYTKIEVSDLHEGIARTLDKNSGRKQFSASLTDIISTHYAYIIAKGFEVTINGVTIEPRTIKIAFAKPKQPNEQTILPFMFRGTMDEVDVYLVVGLTRKVPSRGEITRGQRSTTNSSRNAGWTVVCNDRVVLYNDRTEMTGWGDAGVPQYHTKFNAISGIVEFRSEDPGRLPTTTTKRGIDASSPLYLRVKNKMREGMKVFIDYTNKWKDRPKDSSKHIAECAQLSLPRLKNEAGSLAFKSTRTLPVSEQYKPSLPLPHKPEGRRISFTKSEEEIATVAGYLEISDLDPSDVGERCFDRTYVETGR